MISFRRIVENDLEMILHWRTKPEITRYMNSDIDFDLEKQKRWYKDVVCKRTRAQHWVILQADRPIGVLNIADYDQQNKQTSWGFYIGETDAWLVGALIPVYFYNYMFFTRDKSIKKIVGQVFNLNTKVLQIHRFHGCIEKEVIENLVFKNNQYFDVTIIEMTRDVWIAQQARFAKYYADFED
jgi:RimJ/RimL family protein N-acetyltransferase